MDTPDNGSKMTSMLTSCAYFGQLLSNFCEVAQHTGRVRGAQPILHQQGPGVSNISEHAPVTPPEDPNTIREAFVGCYQGNADASGDRVRDSSPTVLEDQKTILNELVKMCKMVRLPSQVI